MIDLKMLLVCAVVTGVTSYAIAGRGIRLGHKMRESPNEDAALEI